MNSVVLIGHLVRDPELKFSNDGTAWCTVRLAVNRAGKRQSDGSFGAGFFDVTLKDKNAENVAQYLVKGSQAAFSGQLRFDEWEKDGQKRSKVDVMAWQVQFLSRPDDEGGETADGQQTTRPATTAPVDDDIPF